MITRESTVRMMFVSHSFPFILWVPLGCRFLMWQGKEQLAEEEWRFACDNINPGMVFDGCAKYKDQDWLRRIRRWPPLMADKMDNFLKLRSSPKLWEVGVCYSELLQICILTYFIYMEFCEWWGLRAREQVSQHVVDEALFFREESVCLYVMYSFPFIYCIKS